MELYKDVAVYVRVGSFVYESKTGVVYTIFGNLAPFLRIIHI